MEADVVAKKANGKSEKCAAHQMIGNKAFFLLASIPDMLLHK